MHLLHFIVSVQQIHNAFINNYMFLTALLHVSMFASNSQAVSLLKLQSDKMETVKQVMVTAD